MNKFCFGAIYNGRLWEKELRVSTLKEETSPSNLHKPKDSPIKMKHSLRYPVHHSPFPGRMENKTFAHLTKKTKYLKTVFCKNISCFSKTRFNMFMLWSILFDRFMSSAGTITLILFLTLKTRQSVVHYRNRLFRF